MPGLLRLFKKRILTNIYNWLGINVGDALLLANAGFGQNSLNIIIKLDDNKYLAAYGVTINKPVNLSVLTIVNNNVVVLSTLVTTKWPDRGLQNIALARLTSTAAVLGVSTNSNCNAVPVFINSDTNVITLGTALTLTTFSEGLQIIPIDSSKVGVFYGNSSAVTVSSGILTLSGSSLTLSGNRTVVGATSYGYSNGSIFDNKSRLAIVVPGNSSVKVYVANITGNTTSTYTLTTITSIAGTGTMIPIVKEIPGSPNRLLLILAVNGFVMRHVILDINGSNAATVVHNYSDTYTSTTTAAHSVEFLDNNSYLCAIPPVTPVGIVVVKYRINSNVINKESANAVLTTVAGSKNTGLVKAEDNKCIIMYKGGVSPYPLNTHVLSST